MFERYTSELRQVLCVAHKAASNACAKAIEPEHVLAAVLKVAPDSLRGQPSSAATSSNLLQRLGAQSRLGHVDPAHFEIPFSPATKSVLQEALATADRMEHRWIRAEHMLLAVLHEEGSLAARVLREIGVDADVLAVNAVTRPPREDEPFTTGPRAILVKAD
jgi:ATP-dependent Clp protease ATP-binding subunit ClpC